MNHGSPLLHPEPSLRERCRYALCCALVGTLLWLGLFASRWLAPGVEVPISRSESAAQIRARAAERLMVDRLALEARQAADEVKLLAAKLAVGQRTEPAPSGELPLPDETINPQWETLDHQRLALVAQRDQLLETMTPAHPAVQGLEDRLHRFEQSLQGIPRSLASKNVPAIPRDAAIDPQRQLLQQELEMATRRASAAVAAWRQGQSLLKSGELHSQQAAMGSSNLRSWPLVYVTFAAVFVGAIGSAWGAWRPDLLMSPLAIGRTLGVPVIGVLSGGSDPLSQGWFPSSELSRWALASRRFGEVTVCLFVFFLSVLVARDLTFLMQLGAHPWQTLHQGVLALLAPSGVRL